MQCSCDLAMHDPSGRDSALRQIVGFNALSLDPSSFWSGRHSPTTRPRFPRCFARWRWAAAPTYLSATCLLR
eukprot:6212856-Pleurochrysis_carterae.AAC.5